MFELDKGSSKLIFKFENYVKEEERNDDTPWPGIYAEVDTPIATFETAISDIMYAEIDNIRDLLESFLHDEMEEVYYYEPMEESFNMVFYPKGRLFGRTYDDTGNLIEEKEIEMSIRIPDDVYLSDASIKFVLNDEDVERLYDYIKNL
jgi:hypothetical protein